MYGTTTVFTLLLEIRSKRDYLLECLVHSERYTHFCTLYSAAIYNDTVETQHFLTVKSAALFHGRQTSSIINKMHNATLDKTMFSPQFLSQQM